jgi:hypothetical protein
MTVSAKQQTVHLGEISTEELRLVKSAVDFVKWDSESRSGPIVKSLNGRRVWQVTSDDSRVTIFGDECQFEGIYMLSTQFIANCLPLIKLDDNLRLSIVNRQITATSISGTVTMYCGSMTDNFVTSSQVNTVFAHLPFRSLFRAIDTASELPDNVSPDALRRNDDPPPATITIGNNYLTCFTDWRSYGCQDVTTSAAASTLSNGAISVCAQTLNRMVNLFGLVGNPEFTVAFDPLTSNFVEFSTSACHIAVRRKLVGSDLLLKQIRETLTGLFQQHTVSDRGAIAAIIDDCPIRICILESESTGTNIIRLTHTVLRDASQTLDLLKEINVFNQQLVCSRAWIEDDRVILGVDLDQSDVAKIYEHLKKLAADTSKLDGVLEPLGA